MKKLSAITLLLFMSLSYRAQAHTPPANMPDQKEGVLRINLLGIPGFGFEKGIGQNFTIRPEAGIGWPVFTKDADADGITQSGMKSLVNPYILLELRYYYNLQRRLEQGKSISHFSGNFIAPFYRYNAYENITSQPNGDRLLRDVHYYGVWWGIQRTLGKDEILYIDFCIGPGMKTNFKDYADYSTSLKLGFGFQL